MNSSDFILTSGPEAKSVRALVSQPAPFALGPKILRELQESAPAGFRAAPPWLRAQLQELGNETDPELFFQGLLGAARQLRSEGSDLPAQWILARLAQADLPAGVREKAARELSAYAGGNFGVRSEFLMSRFAGTATDWRVIVPMLGASLVGRWVGTAALGRFAGMTARGASPWFVEWFGSRLAASTVGFAAEVPAFAGLSRGLSTETTGPFSDDLARAGLSLGALKVFAGLGNAGARWLTPAGAAPSRSAVLLSQTSAFLGLVGAHQLEARFGLRPHVDGGEMLLDSFAAFLGLQVGARLGGGVLGEGYARFHRDLEIRSQLLEASRLGLRFPRPPAADGLVAATAGGRPKGFSDRGFASPWLMMANSNGGSGNGKKGDSLVPVEVPSLVGNKVPRAEVHDQTYLPANEVPSIMVEPALLEPEDPYIGRLIDGRYKVERKLGEGGMGKVYFAVHEVLGKKVAIKVLRDNSMAADKSLLQRFLDEARAASTIGNPHIVDVSDFGLLPDGSTYFVMEYLEGETLGKLVEGEQPVPIPRLLHIARQIAEGLGAAHRAQIVHRDLKPDNILLIQHGSDADFPKIFDFGIAKIMNSNLRLTQQGMTFGSVHYMSPEQAMGIAVDPRSDVYAFGVLLYEMASGKLPFDAPDRVNIMHQQVSKPPPKLAEVSPQEIPADLEALIYKCMAKKPEQRYQSMEEVATELERIQAEVAPGYALVVRPPSDPGLPSNPRPPSKPSPQRPLLLPLQADPSQTEFVYRPPKPRRWPLYLSIGGAGATTLALVAAIMATRKTQAVAPDAMPAPPDAAPPTPPDAKPPVISIEPLQPELHSVSLRVSPADAHIFRDGQDLGTKALTVDVEAGSKVKLEVRRRGFKTQVVVLDGSQEKVSVRLEREAPPPRRIPPKENPPPKKNPDEVVSPWKVK